MKLRIFNSIGGPRIIGSVGPVGGRMKDILELKVPDEDRNALAIGLIQSINMEFSPELIKLCGQVVDLAEAEASETEQPNITDDTQAFVKACEDNAGEHRRETESDGQYIARLQRDYSNDLLAKPEAHEHVWRYVGYDRGGSHKGESMYECTFPGCGAHEYHVD